MFIVINIFGHAKLEIALGVSASNQQNIESNNSAAQGMSQQNLGTVCFNFGKFEYFYPHLTITSRYLLFLIHHLAVEMLMVDIIQ